MIDNNPAVKVSLPKIHDKNIIRLDVDEVAQLLDEVESGESLSKRQQMYHERTKKTRFGAFIAYAWHWNSCFRMRWSEFR